MSTKMLACIVFVLALAVAKIGFAAPSVPPLNSLTREQAQAVDAEKIGAIMGVSSSEARNRLKLQDATVALSKSLRAKYIDRLAGIYREWSPTPRFVVRLKGQQLERSRFYTFDGKTFEVSFISGAENTISELREALRANLSALAMAFPTLQATRTDEKTGEVVIDIMAADAKGDANARAQAILGVPARVEVGDMPGLLAISGSGSLDIGGVAGECTGGFVVSNSGNTIPGIVTAGHCPNNATTDYITLDANSINLTLVAEVWNGSEDLQWYRPTQSSDYSELEATFFATGADNRTVYGAFYLSDTNVGDALCFFGQSSGDNCGVVDALDYNPNLPNNGCGGYTCEAAFVSVAAPASDTNFICNPGDSGAPVFRDNYAYGILSGGAFSQSTGKCARIFYTPLDKLDDLGIHVMIPS
ncbi:S1 family peptidase [Xanthomonas campestris pv. phormiicola]|nr:S1 family peptidase [Xanthomonas campestris pv. phormiicola]UYC17459.1 S1 family peptidase [Xanthomonas campestris pv. phormiicola]